MEKVNWKNKEEVNRYHREYDKNRTLKQIRRDRENTKRWEKLHPKYHCSILRLVRERLYDKLHTVQLHSTGKNIYVNKRQNPVRDTCEFCPSKKFVQYHHWDDSQPQFGIWLCAKCHRIANSIEMYLEKKLFRNKYLQLKEDIENGKA